MNSLWLTINTLENIKDELDNVDIKKYRMIKVNNRVKKININNIGIIIKEKERGNKKDNIKHEYNVGKVINMYKNTIPNIVYTFDLIKIKDRYNLLVEEIKGDVVKKNYSLDTYFRLLLQIAFTLEFLQKKIEFTHYNLHSHNVIITELEKDYYIKYGDYILQTNKLAVLIDFGRSYTNITGGHEYLPKGVKSKFNKYHDILLYLRTTFKDNYPNILYDIYSLYGFYDFDIDMNSKDFYSKLRKQKFNDVSANNLSNFLINKYGFKPVYKDCDFFTQI